MVRKRPAADSTGDPSMADPLADTSAEPSAEKSASAEKPAASVRKRPAADNTDDRNIAEPLANKPRSGTRVTTPTNQTKIKNSTCFGKKYLKHILSKCTKKMLAAFNSRTRRPKRLATACSGSGMAELAHQIIMEHAKQPALLDFSCENDKAKQRYLSAVVHPHFDPGTTNTSPCCFDTINELGSGVAKCCTHRRSCEVPRCSDVFAAGFSCKDFSTLSNKVTCFFGLMKHEKTIQQGHARRQ